MHESWEGMPRPDPLFLLVFVQDAIEIAVRDTLAKAGKGRHVLNLGHGVLQGTPEEAVAHMFDLTKQLKY